MIASILNNCLILLAILGITIGIAFSFPVDRIHLIVFCNYRLISQIICIQRKTEAEEITNNSYSIIPFQI
jgi:hypothetical protein